MGSFILQFKNVKIDMYISNSENNKVLQLKQAQKDIERVTKPMGKEENNKVYLIQGTD